MRTRVDDRHGAGARAGPAVTTIRISEDFNTEIRAGRVARDPFRYDASNSTRDESGSDANRDWLTARPIGFTGTWRTHV